jgi:hypothetical protein
MRHTYYTCDRCGRSSLSTACIIGSLIGFALLMAAAVTGGCVRR